MFDITTIIDSAKLQRAKDILSIYEEDKNLIWFDILHIYPNYNTKLSDNDCYHDSLKFKAVIFNTKLNKYKVLLDRHDQLNFKEDVLTNKLLPLNILRVFADGSIVITFSSEVRVYGNLFQVLEFTTRYN